MSGKRASVVVILCLDGTIVRENRRHYMLFADQCHESVRRGSLAAVIKIRFILGWQKGCFTVELREGVVEPVFSSCLKAMFVRSMRVEISETDSDTSRVCQLQMFNLKLRRCGSIPYLLAYLNAF